MNNESENEQITQLSTLHLLESLLNSIPHTIHVKGKWSLIATKLSILKTNLSDLSLSPPNSLSTQLLLSLSQTLSRAIYLSSSCQSPTLPTKLKTQNDVDSLSAQLDILIHDCDVIIQSGILDVVGSTPSKRESVRAESRNLITRLQIGSLESKNSAMDSLLKLLQEDDKNVLIAVAQGVVPVLVRLLATTEMKEKTVTAIARISKVDSSKHVLIAEGLPLLNDLIRVVESGNGFAKEKACVVLHSLSQSKENARAIGCRGGVSSLLEICRSGTPSSQGVAAGVLRNMALFDEIKESFIQEDAIFVLLGVAASGTVLAQQNAIGCLSNLVSGDDNLKDLVAKEGGIECLKNFWDSVPGLTNLEVVVDLLRNFVSCPSIAEVIVENGFLNRVVAVLNCGVLGVRISAARAICDLGFNTKTRKELGELGCIPPLIRMLDGKAIEEKESAAKALATVLMYPGNRRIFGKEERGITSAVPLLNPLVQNLDKKYPVSILASLVHLKGFRKQMVACGACIHLQKLVEMDVEGAKKLLESLGHAKLWGVFSKP